MASLRILIVDDHEVIRRGLRSLLSSRPEWEICGEAADGQAAIEKVGSLRPDLVLMDVTMPVMTGTEAARAIRLSHVETKVIIISQNEPELTRRIAMEVGASACVAKSDLSRDLLSTIEKVAQRLTAKPAAFEEAKAQADENRPRWLGGGGEMGALMRSKDWRGSPLGPLEHWPRSLQVSAGICVSSRFDLIVWWGPELVMLYNDSYRRTLGRKHPDALGRPGREVYPEIWDVIGPMLEHVLATGEATWSADLLLLLERNGYPEETYHTFSYTPIRDADGRVVGVITPVSETTDEVISQRRLLTLRDLASRSVDAKNETEAWEFAAKALGGNPYDIPFAVLYKFDREITSAEAVAFAGIARGNSFLLDVVDLHGEAPIAPLIRRVVDQGEAVEFTQLKKLGIPLPGGFWGVNPTDLILLPITQTGHESGMGVLVAGVNCHKKLDEDYRGFLNLVAGQIAKSVADARVVDEERRRAESLAALDRAKTAFFSNISHELRTPLTLILGPLEELRARATDPTSVSLSELDLVHRNATRLLKLVNTLLEFSRIEAGRVQATYQAVKLGEATAEIASVFRSAMERAGLQFDIRCEEPRARMYVDKQMWEKVILNLLSNALKFTHTGKISLLLTEKNGMAELRVEDTGVGIPAQEMPHLFERFHRIEGTHGRTNEGTGIGLALVQELVKLHGGTIRAQSELGRGSEFVVTIPAGSAHLPQDHILASPNTAGRPTDRQPYVDEAMAWFPEDLASSSRQANPPSGALSANSATVSAPQPRILLVEDNADMRQYLKRLLSEEGYSVDLAPDGVAALVCARETPPDLILSDVMLPKMDGINLIRRLRENRALTDVPIVLLSARTGEDFRLQGLEAGADDYLIKPFYARELLSRIKLHLELNRRRLDSASRVEMPADVTLMGTWDVNMQTNEAFWSPGLFALLGYAPNECTASWDSWLARVHAADLQTVRELRESAIADRREYRCEYRIALPDGKTRWVEARGRFYFDDMGKPYRDLGSMQDISLQKILQEETQRTGARPAEQHEERKALEERLTEVSAHAELLDLVTDGVFICDTAHRITYWNRAAERLYGWSAEEAVGRDVSVLLQTEYPISFVDLLSTLEERGRWEGELVHTTRYGMRVVVYSRWIHKRGDRGEFKGWLEINADITQQRQAEETARRLSGRILQLQDEERRKIARELHDSVGQYLAMLKITIDRGERSRADAPNRQLLDQCSQIVDQCIAETRTMSYLLHPPLLDENGLISAARWYVEGFAARSEIDVQMTMPPSIPRLLKEIETTLFRILQESLTNVHRHSESKKVNVEIFYDAHTVSLRVRDYGKGIPLERIRSFRDRGAGMGVGLGGMRERVRELGGILRIEPGDPTGTVILVEIPLIEGQKGLAAQTLPQVLDQPTSRATGFAAARANGTTRD
jgi:PAS domain S-box-containing protein